MKRLRRRWLSRLTEEVKEARNRDLLKVVDAAAKRAGEQLVGRECGNSLRRAQQDKPPAPNGSHTRPTRLLSLKEDRE